MATTKCRNYNTAIKAVRKAIELGYDSLIAIDEQTNKLYDYGAVLAGERKRMADRQNLKAA